MDFISFIIPILPNSSPILIIIPAIKNCNYVGTLFPLTDDGYYCADHGSHYVETWLEMEKLVDEGLVKSIGLSNFNKKQVREILNIPGAKYKPAVLQNESHPYLQEKDLRDFCKINGIIFQVYFYSFTIDCLRMKLLCK